MNNNNISLIAQLQITTEVIASVKIYTVYEYLIVLLKL